MTALLLLFTGSGLLLAAIALPMIGEKIKPNLFYGFRVRKTLEIPRIWYAANKYAGERLFFAGIAITLAAVVLYFIPGVGLDGYAFGVLAVLVVAIAITMVQSLRYLRRWKG